MRVRACTAKHRSHTARAYHTSFTWKKKKTITCSVMRSSFAFVRSASTRSASSRIRQISSCRSSSLTGGGEWVDVCGWVKGWVGAGLG